MELQKNMNLVSKNQNLIYFFFARDMDDAGYETFNLHILIVGYMDGIMSVPLVHFRFIYHGLKKEQRKRKKKMSNDIKMMPTDRELYNAIENVHAKKPPHFFFPFRVDRNSVKRGKIYIMKI